jgi:putative endonuclease
MQDDDCLVFVEVRYRSGARIVDALLTVDAHKQRKLATTAAIFLAKNPRYGELCCRFDVIGVDRDTHGTVTVDWMQDAFRPGG